MLGLGGQALSISQNYPKKEKLRRNLTAKKHFLRFLRTDSIRCFADRAKQKSTVKQID